MMGSHMVDIKVCTNRSISRRRHLSIKRSTPGRAQCFSTICSSAHLSINTLLSHIENSLDHRSPIRPLERRPIANSQSCGLESVQVDERWFRGVWMETIDERLSHRSCSFRHGSSIHLSSIIGSNTGTLSRRGDQFVRMSSRLRAFLRIGTILVKGS